jgi:hypothetical protein
MPQQTNDSDPISVPRADWKVRLLFRAAGLGLLLWYFHLFVGIYIDDAFITLSYASTLAKCGVWGMAPDLTSNAATSPLNVILLALTVKIFRDPPISLWLFNVLLGVLIYSSLRYFSLRIFSGELFAVLATALLLTNPLLNSTQGLESYLLIAMVLLSCRLWDMQRYKLLGLALGGLFLTRPDALALAAVFVAALLVRKRWNTALTVSGFFLLPVIPWLSYSWYHLGSLFPDTLLIKLGQRTWAGTTFFGGLLFYWLTAPTATLLSLAPAPAVLYLRPGPPSLRKHGGPRRALLLGLASYALIHFVTYSLLIRVPPYHWYYAMEIGTLVVVAAFVACDASQTYRRTNFAVLGVLILLSAGFAITRATLKKTAALTSNWGTPGQYKDMAAWINLHVPDTRIRLGAELGTLQYYTNADLINEFSDRSPAVELLQRPHSRIGGALLRWNYRHLVTEDFSQIRYDLVTCRQGDVPEMMWTTEAPVTGTHRLCLYKTSHEGERTAQ